MKKLITLLLTICLFGTVTQAQSHKKHPVILYLIEDQNQTTKTYDLIIDPHDINKLTIIDTTIAIGNPQPNVVMKVVLKNDLILLNLSALFKRFNLEKAYESWPVKIDGVESVEPTAIISTADAVKNIEANEASHYIYITTKFGAPKSSVNAVH